MKFNTFITGKYGAADGAVEITENEIVVFRKSAFTRTFFGAVGTAIAAGKEVGRFTRNDVATYDVQEKTFKNVAVLTFRDGSSLSFTMKSDLTDAFKAFMNRKPSIYDYVEQDAGVNEKTFVPGEDTAGTGAETAKKKPTVFAGICFLFAALCSSANVFVGVFSISSLVNLTCLVLVAVGIFTSRDKLSAIGSGVLALSFAISLVGAFSIGTWSFILMTALSLTFWILLTLAFAGGNNKRTLFFAAGITLALRGVCYIIYMSSTIKNLEVLDYIAMLLAQIDLIAMCIAAFVLSTQKSENV